MSQRDRVSDVAAFFDGTRLTIARQLAGLRKSDLATLIDMSPTAVAGWEAGTKRPTAPTVAQLALSLAVDPGFFAARPNLLSELGATPHFRSLRSTSQLARDQAFAYGRIAVEIAAALEKHVELPELDLPTHSVDLDEEYGREPEEAARELRRAWGVPQGPVAHLIRLAELHGILVVFSPPQGAAVDAYSFDSQLRPVVVLNPIKSDYYRQRFDVAHELGHLVMHSDAEPGGRVVESQAQRFAAEFLTPHDEIADLLPTAMNGNAWVTLGRLKEQWGVSIQALLFRARSLGRLSEVSYRNAVTTVSARGWRRNEPGLITSMEQPSLLPRAIEVLNGVGVSSGALVEQCRVPSELFNVVVARTPGTIADLNTAADGEPEGSGRKVISLLPRLPTGRQEWLETSEGDTTKGTRS